MARRNPNANFFQQSVQQFGHCDPQPVEKLSVAEAIKLAKSHWQGQNVSVETYVSYSSHLKEFSIWAHENLRPCLISEMNGWYTAKYREYLCTRQSMRGGKLSGTTIQHHLDTLSSFFRVMVLFRQMENNPLDYIEGPNSRHNRLLSVPKRPCPLTVDVANQLLSLKYDYRLGLRDRVMLHFLILFAPRTSELAELTWMDLEWNKITIERKKKNEPGTFVVPTYLFQWLQEMREKYGAKADDPIFPSQGGKRGLSARGIRQVIKRLGERVGINLCPKDFRTLLMSELSRTEDGKLVQMFVGHLGEQTSKKFYVKRARSEVQHTLDVWKEAILSGVNLTDGFEEDEAA
ncbi:tyrosine-type recombinase/integrase [Alicyclobacillus cycloheptanicus]|uniref:Site-specific recombinase XerD n=1 Tax=Alicyclobacillus cycloheptanicus TaxID=1457 RepID=A0ABT9XK09_9BACL|nr:tyrosine-type recombinase/integrase [Alicyclobacillus cycloheptanicus]MDQ0190460.1 site-specific recombinase XerD [Alicyclobacillus cycloheptanicus]WDM00776.1 tyrosine-type recombinase/integrase [Alicyclobacillus cycloheptanicus]